MKADSPLIHQRFGAKTEEMHWNRPLTKLIFALNRIVAAIRADGIANATLKCQEDLANPPGFIGEGFET